MFNEVEERAIVTAKNKLKNTEKKRLKHIKDSLTGTISSSLFYV